MGAVKPSSRSSSTTRAPFTSTRALTLRWVLSPGRLRTSSAASLEAGSVVEPGGVAQPPSASSNSRIRALRSTIAARPLRLGTVAPAKLNAPGLTRRISNSLGSVSGQASSLQPTYAGHYCRSSFQIVADADMDRSPRSDHPFSASGWSMSNRSDRVPAPNAARSDHHIVRRPASCDHEGLPRPAPSVTKRACS